METKRVWARVLGILLVVLVPCLMAAASHLSSLRLYPLSGETTLLDIEDSSGVDVVTVDSNGNVTLAETGGSTSVPDFSVAGYAKLAGSLEVDGAAKFDGAVTLGDAGADSLTVNCTTSSLSAAAAVLNIGSASSTTGSRVHVFDGGSDNKPGVLELYADNGTPVYLFASTAGALRVHSAYPTDDDSDGSAIGTLDTGVDLDLTATGGATGDPDLSVAGYAQCNGTLELNGALDVDSSVNYSSATVITETAGAYHTQLRIGTGSTPTVAGSITADGLFVEGAAELDSTVQIDGVVTATADVDLDATGGSTGDPDFSVDGYAKFAGTVEYSRTCSLWFDAARFSFPTANPAALNEESGVKVVKFADSSADDHAWLQIVWPAHIDATQDASVYYYYVLDSNCTETEGAIKAKGSVLGDGSAVSAAATDLTTVLDTPQDDLKLNITTACTIPAALITANEVTILDIYHDVADPFGDAMMLVGVRIDYTANRP
jgi:hypothetical protein